jgi:hypothetical protein
MHYTTIDWPPKVNSNPRPSTRHHWPTKVKDSNPRPCTTPPLTPKKSEIRPQGHALHHHWPPKSKDSNPRPCTTSPLTSKKSKIRTQDHSLQQHWPPQDKDSNTRPCTTPLTPKRKRFEPTNPPCTIHHHWPPKDSNPRPLISSDLQKSKIRTQDHALHHHGPSKRQDSNPKRCTPRHEGNILLVDIKIWVVGITWTLILDPRHRILHHWIAPPGFNLGCRRCFVDTLAISLRALDKPFPACWPQTSWFRSTADKLHGAWCGGRCVSGSTGRSP